MIQLLSLTSVTPESTKGPADTQADSVAKINRLSRTLYILNSRFQGRPGKHKTLSAAQQKIEEVNVKGENSKLDFYEGAPQDFIVKTEKIFYFPNKVLETSKCFPFFRGTHTLQLSAPKPAAGFCSP